MAVIFITGAGSGFGYRMAKRLAGQHHRIYAGFRDLRGGNAEAAKALARSGNVHAVQADVTRELDTAINEIVKREDRLDVVIANAGVWGPGVLEAYTLKEWQALFDINCFGVIRTLRAALPAMRGQGGGLAVLISSLQARFILPYSGPYIASKWAAEAAMETFRYETRPFGVECCIVEPYDYLTEMKAKAKNWRPSDKRGEGRYDGATAVIEQFYMKPDPARAGDPEQVITAVADLLALAPGQRPVQTTVGNPLPQIDAINTLQEEMQRALLPQIGLSHLLP